MIFSLYKNISNDYSIFKYCVIFHLDQKTRYYFLTKELQIKSGYPNEMSKIVQTEDKTKIINPKSPKDLNSFIYLGDFDATLEDLNIIKNFPEEFI